MSGPEDEPTPGPHDECAAEMRALTAEVGRLRTALAEEKHYHAINLRAEMDARKEAFARIAEARAGAFREAAGYLEEKAALHSDASITANHEHGELPTAADEEMAIVFTHCARMLRERAAAAASPGTREPAHVCHCDDPANCYCQPATPSPGTAAGASEPTAYAWTLTPCPLDCEEDEGEYNPGGFWLGNKETNQVFILPEDMFRVRALLRPTPLLEGDGITEYGCGHAEAHCSHAHDVPAKFKAVTRVAQSCRACTGASGGTTARAGTETKGEPR